MAKGKWKRDRLTGLPESIADSELEFYDQELEYRYPDCDIFNIQSFAAAAGYKSIHYFETVVLSDPSSPFHAHKVKSDNGRTVTYATHTNSAEFGGKIFRERKNQRRMSNLTNVSSGSCIRSK